jgi:hypothetical protein
MSRDLQIAAALITLALGLGLVNGRHAAELVALGKVLSTASAGLLVYHALGGK